MGRYTGPSCRLCRREGIKLMLKGIRCESAKCPMERQHRSNPPGMHNWRRSRSTEYGVRLREKQKVKRYYGVFEKQFSRYFQMAEKRRGNTGEALLQILELRLDNAIYKLGWTPSRAAARQIIVHGHIYINGRRVNRPGYLVSVGDSIAVKPAEKSRKQIQAWLEELGEPHVQEWLRSDMSQLSAEVVSAPSRDDVMIPVEEQLIVELCSQ